MVLTSKNIEALYKVIPGKVVVKEILNFFPENVLGCDVSYKEKAKVSCVVFNIKEKR